MGTSHEGQHVEQQTSFEGSTHSTVVPTKPAGILERSLSAKREARPDGKVVLEEEDCYTKLGFCFSPAKKWTILSVIFIVQVRRAPSWHAGVGQTVLILPLHLLPFRDRSP